MVNGDASVGTPVMAQVDGDKTRPAGRAVAEVSEQEVIAVPPPAQDMMIGAAISPTDRPTLGEPWGLI